MHNFIRIFPSPTFAEVLSFFLLHPKEKFYQSHIATTTGYGLLQIQRALKRLEEAELIIKTREGNRAYYRTNQDHPALEDLKRAFMKTVVFEESIKRALSSLKKKIRFCFVFGSIARDEEGATSDLDLFLVGTLTLRETATILGPLQRAFHRECNITLYSQKEFKTKIEEKNTFVAEVIKGPKIWLFGDESEFEAMVAGR